MGFEKFGKIGYISETKVADFVKYLEKGKIMATQCRRCGQLYFPPRAECPNDFSDDIIWKPLSGRCKLITYTTAYFAPTGFQEDVPYTLALARCEEGVNVYARLNKNIKENEISIGMNLKLVPLQLPNGRITYEFRKT